MSNVRAPVTRVRLPPCTTAFERSRVLALSCSLAAPRSHVQILQCTLALGGHACSLSLVLAQHRARRETPSTPSASLSHAALKASASQRLQRRKVPKARRALSSPRASGHTRTGFEVRGKCSRGLHPVGSLGALRSGAPSTSALTLPSKGRPTAGHTGSLRHGQPRRWPPLMSNVRHCRCRSHPHAIGALGHAEI